MKSEKPTDKIKSNPNINYFSLKHSRDYGNENSESPSGVSKLFFSNLRWIKLYQSTATT